jgi:hypothetical protein
VELYWQGKTEELGEKPAPVPLCPPKFPPGDANPGLRGERPATNRLSLGKHPPPPPPPQSQGKAKNLERKAFPVLPHCPPQMPLGPTLGTNLGLCGGKVVTNRLSYSTDSTIWLQVVLQICVWGFVRHCSFYNVSIEHLIGPFISVCLSHALPTGVGNFVTWKHCTAVGLEIPVLEYIVMQQREEKPFLKHIVAQWPRISLVQQQPKNKLWHRNKLVQEWSKDYISAHCHVRRIPLECQYTPKRMPFQSCVVVTFRMRRKITLIIKRYL